MLFPAPVSPIIPTTSPLEISKFTLFKILFFSYPKETLSNIIFSKKIKIIEIFPDSRPEEDEFVYYQLSKILNFPHHVFVVDKNNCHNGIYINIELFKKTLENIL